MLTVPDNERAAAWRRFNALPPEERRRMEMHELPGCVTCGARPTGRFPDGSPSFGHHSHEKER